MDVEGAEDFVGRMDEGEDSGEDRDESRVGLQEGIIREYFKY